VRKTLKRLGRLVPGITAGLTVMFMALGATSAQAAGKTVDDEQFEPTIINGQPASDGRYPWMVAIARASDGRQFCGGSLVAADIVLTAAHCTEGRTAANTVIRHGSVNLNQTTVYPVTRIHIPGNYNRNTLQNDWSLLKLSRPVPNAQPIALAASDHKRWTSFEVAGWGVTETGSSTSSLRWVRVPYVSDADCSRAYREFRAATMLCAGDLANGGVDSCQGDSGGPLMAVENGRTVQAGVVSWGYGCAQRGQPGVYANVGALNSAITNAINAMR
jgi:trypsin